MTRCCRICAFIVVGLLSAAGARADDSGYVNRTTFGEVGLLELPSARMAPEGELAFTYGVLRKTQRYNLSFQALPWLQGDFRYTEAKDLDGAVLPRYDRSFGVKLRFVQETEFWPEVSLGIRDIIGTGLYSTEYLVASKRWSDFDFTLGMGWGRLADNSALNNPIAAVIPSFRVRQDTTNTLGGTVSFGSLFHGERVGIFGGVLWRTPIENLRVMVEYSSDGYKQERRLGSVVVHSPFNFGLSYRFFNYVSVSAAYLYGTTAAVMVSIDTDPTRPASIQRFGPEVPKPVIRSAGQQASALTGLLARYKPAAAGAPFVSLPAPVSNPDSIKLASALMSSGPGVHDVDIAGDTLIVMAHLTRPGPQQCVRYAQVASNLAPKLQKIALSDLDDPSGDVAICEISHAGLIRTASDVPDQSVPAGPMPDSAAMAAKTRDDIRGQAIRVEAVSFDNDQAWVYFTNYRYLNDTEAVGRIARILMANAPPGVEVFHIISVRGGVALREFKIARSALERSAVTSGTAQELRDAVAFVPAPLANPVLDAAWSGEYPRFTWDIGPSFREGLFDPSRPIQIQIYGALNAKLTLLPNLDIEARGEFNIWNNYNLIASDSVLPHVRSDFPQYLKHGINGIANLDAVYRGRLSRDVYFSLKAGYLESTFAGAGVQVLWRPENERFAFGADLYQVWQRDYDRLFGLRDYHVLTGHVSAYYESPWYDLNFAVHAGRYLAGDYGATFEITRRFETGVEIGFFATFTNVPFKTFGEGSFDKGLIIHIPFEWALPINSQSAFDFLLRSLTRDGGQRLENDDSLFRETRATSYGDVTRHIEDIAAP